MSPQAQDSFSVTIGSRTFSSNIERFDNDRPVFRMKLHFSLFQRCLRLCVHFLRFKATRRSIQQYIPWIEIPNEIVVKQEKQGHEAELQHERQVYRDHPQWHGRILPLFFEDIHPVGSTPAISLGVAKGVPLDQISQEERQEALKKIEATYATISKAGIIHGDPRLEHTFIHEDGAMLIDWGLAEAVSPSDAETRNMLDFEDLMDDLSYLRSTAF